MNDYNKGWNDALDAIISMYQLAEDSDFWFEIPEKDLVDDLEDLRK